MGELQWITQFSQLSASAALTAVLGFLLYQMPRHFAEERRSREQVAAQHAAALALVLARSEEQGRYEREACERRHQEMLQRLDRNHAVLREVKHETGNLAQVHANRQAAEELRGRRRQPSGEGGS